MKILSSILTGAALGLLALGLVSCDGAGVETIDGFKVRTITVGVSTIPGEPPTVAMRKFAELVDGKRTVSQIAAAMGSDRGEKLAPRIYATMKQAGLFDRPRFLTEFEEGTIAWQSCFPEVYRAYH